MPWKEVERAFQLASERIFSPSLYCVTKKGLTVGRLYFESLINELSNVIKSMTN
jgi:hypothetical protein